MKKIPLTQGQFALVDNDDYEELSKYKWCVAWLKSGKYYRALRRTGGPRGQRSVYMHRQIMGLKEGDGFSVDHANHDTLDNRKENLRICNHSQNQMNSKPRGGISVYKGVYWRKEKKRWRSRIKLNGKHISLGYFRSEIEAAKKYNVAAKRYFGEFAYLNKV